MGPDALHPKYLAVKAGDVDPGPFKDRVLLAGRPHQLLGGGFLSAYALEADVAYIFLRWAYTLSAQRIERAIAEAYDAHYLGANIFGSTYRLEVYLHVRAGRTICGEGTAALNARRARDGTPGDKPAVHARGGPPRTLGSLRPRRTGCATRLTRGVRDHAARAVRDAAQARGCGAGRRRPPGRH